jgi:hypothetical protein
VVDAGFGGEGKGGVGDVGGHHGTAVRQLHGDARGSDAFVDDGGIYHEVKPGTAGVGDDVVVTIGGRGGHYRMEIVIVYFSAK